VEKEVDIGKELMTNHISQSWYNHLSDDWCNKLSWNFVIYLSKTLLTPISFHDLCFERCREVAILCLYQSNIVC
jgi:hypothetical protein